MAAYSLISSATAYVEDAIDKIFERTPRWFFPFLYWPAFGFVAVLFVFSGGPWMLLGVAAPVALVGYVRRRGLARAPDFLYVVALLPVSYAAFFMNRFYNSLLAGGDRITIGHVIGATVFVVAVAGYWLALPVGLFAARQWIKASTSPYWTAHRYLPAHPAEAYG
ncbi:MAG: hypothetical protein ACRDRA_18475 [Pseudonocardiaceae bacterium]